MSYGVHVGNGRATDDDSDDGPDTGRQVTLGGWAQYLKDLTARPGWSVTRLASEAGVQRSTVHRWMSGKVVNVTANSIRAIAAAAGDDPDAVILAASHELNAGSSRPGFESIDVWEARVIGQIKADPYLSDMDKLNYETRVRQNAAERRALDALEERLAQRHTA